MVLLRCLLLDWCNRGPFTMMARLDDPRNRYALDSTKKFRLFRTLVGIIPMVC